MFKLVMIILCESHLQYFTRLLSCIHLFFSFSFILCSYSLINCNSCIILLSTVLLCFISLYSASYCPILFYAMLLCSILFCSILFLFILFYFDLFILFLRCYSESVPSGREKVKKEFCPKESFSTPHR